MKSIQLAALPILAGCLPALASPLYGKRFTVDPMVYDFDEIKVTPDLKWVPCYDDFVCTKLQVPLDYEDPSAGTTHVSFIKWYTPNSSSTNKDILLNPGGPGASGVYFLRNELPALRSIVGEANNLVSFDPRGIGASGPADVSCSLGNDTISEPDTPFLDVNDGTSYAKVYAAAATLGDWLTRTHSCENDTAKYVNTVATAQDMLYCTEVLTESRNEDPRESQLWYFGVSYGSPLGMTYASLFPNRVGRIAVDGNVDAEDWYGIKSGTDVLEFDEVLRYFFQTCYDAGELCPFWSNSTSAIEARLNAIMDAVKLNPLPANNKYPEITANRLKMVLFRLLYQPVHGFPFLAEYLVDIEKRNPHRIAVALANYGSPVFPILGLMDWDAIPWIQCIDANGRSELSNYDMWVEYANRTVKESIYGGELAASESAKVLCHNFNIQAPARQVFHGPPGANETSNPLLFLSSRSDPVTPLRAARKMVKRFGGAALLVQNSVGHATLSAESACKDEYLHRYFETGELPAEGTICESEDVPFKTVGKPGEKRMKWFARDHFSL